MSRPSGSQSDKIRKRLRAIGAPCAICGKPIDYDLDWYIDPRDGKRKRHPYSFEYDHIKPQAVGGSNAWTNAQATHRICNERKGSGKRKKPSKTQKATKQIEKILPTSKLW